MELMNIRSSGLEQCTWLSMKMVEAENKSLLVSQCHCICIPSLSSPFSVKHSTPNNKLTCMVLPNYANFYEQHSNLVESLSLNSPLMQLLNASVRTISNFAFEDNATYLTGAASNGFKLQKETQK